MQLAHLLPFLDAEIDRLQKARDLLALTPSSLEIYTDTPDTQPTVDEPLSLSLAADAADAAETSVEQAAKSPVDTPPVIASSPTPPAAALPRRLRRSRNLARTELHVDESRHVKRKRVILSDTALRGHVPSGPVVVSAEEVRKSQAMKTAQTSRAAEIRKAGEEPASSLIQWRTPASDARTVDSLLQRLMRIGTDTEPQASEQFASLGGSESFKPVHGSKLD
jgi:hypothetical protein